MKILSESHPLPADATPRSSRRGRSVSFDEEICSEESESSTFCEARAGDGIELCQGIHTENLTFCSSHQFERNGGDDDDDDDDLPWANARVPSPRSPAYGDGKILYRGINTSGKEYQARFPRKLASAPIAIARRQYSFHILPHSGPFSGPLAKQSFCGKPNTVPSIIPTNLLRRKVLGFNACEPTSPEVTCLGRIKSKKLNRKCGHEPTDSDGLSVDSQTVQKGRCFDTKNQLCGKRSKGRKKKEKARRRFAASDPKSLSSESQTRREKAATLARSLTDILEDIRQAEKKSAPYEPSVPPPNSLLLMRGCRIGDGDMDMDSGSDEQGINNHEDMGSQVEPPRNSLLLMRGCRIRGNFSLPPELSMDRVPLKTKHVQSSTSPIIDNINSDSHHVKKLKARAAQHLSLLDLIEKEENIIDEGVSTSEARDTQGSNAIDEGVSTSEARDRQGSNAIDEGVSTSEARDTQGSIAPDEGASTSEARDTQGSNALDEGVSTSEARDTQGSNPLNPENSPASEDIDMVSKLIKEEIIQNCHRRATLCERRSFGSLPFIEVKPHTKMER